MCDLGFPIRWMIGEEPWKLILGSVFIGFVAYLPWLIETFKEFGVIAVGAIAIAALAVHFCVVLLFGVILFFVLGGDTF